MSEESMSPTIWHYLLLCGFATLFVGIVLAPIFGWKFEFREYDCRDFASANAAQRFFLSHGGPEQDIYHLDRNRDGIACNGLP